MLYDIVPETKSQIPDDTALVFGKIILYYWFTDIGCTNILPLF